MFCLILLAVTSPSCGYDGPSLNVAALNEKLKADPHAFLVVDVRPRALFDEGHIEGAKNIPIEQIDAHMDELIAAPQPVAVVCTCGRRSLDAVKRLNARGAKPFLVVGGMLEWEKAGYPTARSMRNETGRNSLPGPK